MDSMFLGFSPFILKYLQNTLYKTVFHSIACKVFENVLLTKAGGIDEILSHIKAYDCFLNQFRQH